ncbi:hypothetical protein, secreted [Lunatimonas lonarensis]|uniref:Uncharacterized protein n=1 Tax=Lunatimonas lonarensis TaxID=1232681 RepID=R7ZUY1_9BACT|nr:hypothetical protein [Lunatimonas lonarensis]EON77950.1 hypothetical protein, secreted [Lunatimonas lonarensis]
MHLHRIISILLVLSVFAFGARAQQVDSLAVSLENSLKQSLLKSIELKTDSLNNDLGTKLSDLDRRIQMLDQSLEITTNERQLVDKLIERVKLIEDFQQAEKESELNIYKGNYQSAIINLVSMERELKPLLLFNSTREFFNTLNNIGNPTQYPGFNDWFKGFQSYVNENKESSSTLGVVSNLMNLTGNLSAGTPIFGTFSQTLFMGMSTYVDQLGSNKKTQDLRDRSQKMFELVTEIGQFTSDKDLVETEWDAINVELEELKKLYESNLEKNLEILGIKRTEFDRRYTNENDANKRYQYLNELTDIISKKVAEEKNQNPKNWKNTFFYEMSEIQSLKVRFGTITFRISENIGKYNDLTAKYKKSQYLGTKIIDLEAKLLNMKNSFDKTFSPLDYINSANKMYKVY